MLHWPATPAGVGRASRSTETRMPTQTAAEHELAILIVDALNLETIDPTQIDPQAPLFGGDLGLDSIDALEIALAVSKHYGMQLRSDHPDNQRIFSSLRALSEHIERERTV
jgi:acyl carrier protein